MNNIESIEVLVHICKKLGFGIEHNYNENNNRNEYAAVAMTGQRICIVHSIDSYGTLIDAGVAGSRSRSPFAWDEYLAVLLLPCVLDACSFCPVKRSQDEYDAWRLANPFYKHPELKKCKSAKEFFIASDMLVAEDLRAQSYEFFKKRNMLSSGAQRTLAVH